MLRGNYGSIGNAGYFTSKSPDLILVGEIVNIIQHIAKILCGLQKKLFQVHVSNTTTKWMDMMQKDNKQWIPNITLCPRNKSLGGLDRLNVCEWHYETEVKVIMKLGLVKKKGFYKSDKNYLSAYFRTDFLRWVYFSWAMSLNYLLNS